VHAAQAQERAAMNAEKGAMASEHGAASAEHAPKAEPVKPGDEGSFKELKDQKRKNGETEPLDMDHQPSYAAQVKAKENELGRELSPAERRQVRDESPAIASPRPVHQKTSPSYGGRNSKAQIARDAKNQKSMEAAFKRDREAFEKAMRDRARKK